MDAMYGELCVLYEENVRIKSELSELRVELSALRARKDSIVDDSYATAAMAPPSSTVGGAAAPIKLENTRGSLAKLENTRVPSMSPMKLENSQESSEKVENEIVEPEMDAVKNVTITADQKKKEERREYYKQYRMKKKIQLTK